MESHQDFRSLQAKFQASQPQPGQLPRKTLKPEFNKLPKKFPQPELSDQPNKSLQPEFSVVSLKPLELQVADLPKKALQPEFIDLKKLPQPEVTSFPKKSPQTKLTDLKKFPQPEFTDLPKTVFPPEFTDLPRKLPQSKSANLPKKPPQPEFSNLPTKPPQPEFSNLPKKPPQPEFSNLPKKPPQPEFSNLPKKPPKPEFGEFSKKSLQLEAPQVLQPEPLKPVLTNPARPPLELKPSTFSSKFWQPESSETPLRPSQFEFPKKPLQPQADGLSKKSLTQSEFSEVTQTSSSKSESSEPYPNSPQPDFSTLPKKSPQQPELYEVPQTPPWKCESGDPQPHSPQPSFTAFPTKHPQFQLSDLTRTSSEPEVCRVPNKPRQPEFKVFSKPLKPELGHLPRTSSEPEFSSLPRKFVQPERRGQPRKFSQPELKKPLQSEFKEFPRKRQLPGSVSESSLPTAILGSSPRLGVTGTPRWRSEDFQVPRRPRRRPLPSASSLGSPPAKPPLPPGPINIQSFWRASAGATAVQRTHSSAGTHFQAQRPQHNLQNPDEIYELYDAVEPTDDSCPSPRGRDEVQSIQQATRKPQQDSELRKEKATQAQQLPPMDPKLLKQIRKAEKAEREFRKKFKFEGEIVIHTRMMIDPNAKTRRGGGKHLGIRRGEILEVIEFTSKDEMLCRDPKGKYGYVPRIALLPLETEVYDDVGFWDPLESQPFPQGQ